MSCASFYFGTPGPKPVGGISPPGLVLFPPKYYRTHRHPSRPERFLSRRGTPTAARAQPAGDVDCLTAAADAELRSTCLTWLRTVSSARPAARRIGRAGAVAHQIEHLPLPPGQLAARRSQPRPARSGGRAPRSGERPGCGNRRLAAQRATQRRGDGSKSRSLRTKPTAPARRARTAVSSSSVIEQKTILVAGSWRAAPCRLRCHRGGDSRCRSARGRARRCEQPRSPPPRWRPRRR